jgi:hypothetical protein
MRASMLRVGPARVHAAPMEAPVCVNAMTDRAHLGITSLADRTSLGTTQTMPPMSRWESVQCWEVDTSLRPARRRARETRAGHAVDKQSRIPITVENSSLAAGSCRLHAGHGGDSRAAALCTHRARRRERRGIPRLHANAPACLRNLVRARAQPRVRCEPWRSAVRSVEYLTGDDRFSSEPVGQVRTPGDLPSLQRPDESTASA